MSVRAWVVAVVLGVSAGGAAAQGLTVHAAGSLRSAMTELAADFERARSTPVKLVFGPSGLLMDRLAGGEASDVFASANMTHPQALAEAGRAEPVQAFARNALCGLAAPGFSLQGRPLAQRLLDADVRVGTSTPKADPSGDYAFQMFERIEATGAAGPGSATALKNRALQLTGGPDSPKPQPGRSLYGALVAGGQADLFITYCTNVAEARQEYPALQSIPVPDSINVGARYGIVVMKPASPAAAAFVSHVLGAEGRRVLATHGFSPP
jgi:ABC-type molybdate transport system substrate-binding protein